MKREREMERKGKEKEKGKRKGVKIRSCVRIEVDTNNDEKKNWNKK